MRTNPKGNRLEEGGGNVSRCMREEEERERNKSNVLCAFKPWGQLK